MARRSSSTFGQELKRLRLGAQIGLRAFSSLIDMAPSNLSNIERDKAPPPAKREKLELICSALGLDPDDPQREKLFDLAAAWDEGRIPADVREAVRKPGIPVLVRTVANKQLSKKKLRELAEYIASYY
jgi:transcriptional regulator with XRE-family HTH domain